MNVHEYQAKKLLRHHGLVFPEGIVATTAAEAEAAADSMQSEFWVVKAQIAAGDRERYGGIKKAHSRQEVGSIARSLLGSNLVTSQTGEQGMLVKKVYVEQGCDVNREMYLAILVDRTAEVLKFLAASTGGTGIEDQDVREIVDVSVTLGQTLEADELQGLTEALNLDKEVADQFQKICLQLYQALVENDALLIELNPLALTSEGQLTALDVKMEIDDNALIRHEEFNELLEEIRDPNRVFRAQAGYNFVRLSGDIGLVVGGAGLALATMDAVKLNGGEPANFLDLPPVATRANVIDAVKKILEQPSLSCLLVNIIGGGLARCDTVAEGLITVFREGAIQCPLVVRFEGTAKDHAVVLMRNAKLPFMPARDMKDAVERAIKISQGK